MPQAGFDPPFAEGAKFTEWKTDAFTNLATIVGPSSCYKCHNFSTLIYRNLNVVNHEDDSMNEETSKETGAIPKKLSHRK